MIVLHGLETHQKTLLSHSRLGCTLILMPCGPCRGSELNLSGVIIPGPLTRAFSEGLPEIDPPLLKYLSFTYGL